MTVAARGRTSTFTTKAGELVRLRLIWDDRDHDKAQHRTTDLMIRSGPSASATNEQGTAMKAIHAIWKHGQIVPTQPDWAS